MRVCERSTDLRSGQTLARFVDDVKGGSILECGACGHNYVKPYKSGGYDTPEYCPECKIEILYPGWASW